MDAKSSTLKECRMAEFNNIWSPVKGYTAIKEEIFNNFRLHQLAPGHVKLARGILLFGPSGTGKSEMAKCIGHQFGATNFKSINCSDVISSYRGESGLNMKIVFDMAREQEGVSGRHNTLTVTKLKSHPNKSKKDQNIQTSGFKNRRLEFSCTYFGFTARQFLQAVP